MKGASGLARNDKVAAGRAEKAERVASDETKTARDDDEDENTFEGADDAKFEDVDGGGGRSSC
jgi:hypothetical protein